MDETADMKGDQAGLHKPNIKVWQWTFHHPQPDYYKKRLV